MKIMDMIGNCRENEKTAIQYKQESISFKELFFKTSEMARLLEEYKSETIILFLNNCIEYYVSYFTILKLNSVVVPVNILNTEYNLDKIISQTESRLLITKSVYLNKVKNLNIDIWEIDTNKLINRSQNKKNVKKISDEVIMLIETSGSVSEPKLVMLSNENIYSNIIAYKDLVGDIDKNKEVAMIISYLGSSHGNTCEMLFYLYYQIPVVLYDGNFNITKFLYLASLNKITRVHLVSSILMLLCKTDKEIIAKYDLSRLRRISFGSSIFSNSFLDSALQRFPNTILVQDYGLTEASPLVTSLGEKDWLNKFGSIGKALSNVEIKIDIIDENNGIGELLIKGPNVCSGYYKNSNYRIFDNGWLRTGDLVYSDEEGYLFFVGRIGRRFKCNGYTINPEDIEKLIMTYSGVKNVIVYAEKNTVRENKICMDVEIDIESQIDIKKINSFCAKFLSAPKIPQKINIVDKIKCTASGKNKLNLKIKSKTV